MLHYMDHYDTSRPRLSVVHTSSVLCNDALWDGLHLAQSHRWDPPWSGGRAPYSARLHHKMGFTVPKAVDALRTHSCRSATSSQSGVTGQAPPSLKCTMGAALVHVDRLCPLQGCVTGCAPPFRKHCIGSALGSAAGLHPLYYGVIRWSPPYSKGIYGLHTRPCRRAPCSAKLRHGSGLNFFDMVVKGSEFLGLY